MKSKVPVLLAFALFAFAVHAEAASAATRRTEPAPQPRPNGFLSRVDSDADEILKLENGAVIEVTSGYIGYLGYQKKAVVYESAGGCRIWLEGKKVFRCHLLREPSSARKVVVEELSIDTVTGDGEILKAADGRVFEVNSLYTLNTALWLAPFDAVLIDSTQLVNLDEGDEPVEISRLR